MSYRINKTDGTLLVDLVDGSINSSAADITLIGRNYKGFGEIINENFVKILENFASSSAPSNPLRGQLWFDTSDNRLKVYNGTAFTSNGIIVSQTQPQMTAGDIWLNNLTNQMYFFDGTDLVLVGPTYTQAQGVSGFVTQSILSTLQQTKTVIKFFVGNVLIGVWSAAEFTPVTSQLITELVSGSNPTGIIRVGFNTTNDAYKYLGTASKAEALLNGVGTTILADSLLRSDADDVTTGSLKIQNNSGLTIGLNENLILKHSSAALPNASIILQNVANADIAINAKNPAEYTAIFVDSSAARVGIFNTTPAYALDITGDVRIQGNLITSGSSTSVTAEDLRVEDKTIELATITGAALGNDAYIDGGGIVLKSTAGDKTLLWQDSTDTWKSSEHFNLATGKEYKINGTTVLSGTALGATITSAPGLVSTGVLTSLTVDNITINGQTISRAASATPTDQLILQSPHPIYVTDGITTQRITNLGVPTANTDAANKQYVDTYTPVSLVLDITGFSALAGGVNGSIALVLGDLYPTTAYTGAGFGIPASINGRLARVHCVEFGALTVNVPFANLNSSLDKATTAVDQTLNAAPNTVLAVATQLNVPSLASGRVRITTTTGHFYEVGNTITISGCAGSNGFAASGIDGVYVIEQVIANAIPSTQFVIDVSATVATINTETGASYTASSASTTRTPQVGNSNKTVLNDVSFDIAVAGAVSSVVSRSLKQFIVSGGTWTFHSNLTSSV